VQCDAAAARPVEAPVLGLLHWDGGGDGHWLRADLVKQRLPVRRSVGRTALGCCLPHGVADATQADGQAMMPT
jgi:hypothetical protein